MGFYPLTEPFLSAMLKELWDEAKPYVVWYPTPQRGYIGLNLSEQETSDGSEVR